MARALYEDHKLDPETEFDPNADFIYPTFEQIIRYVLGLAIDR
jgi:hypothetical protein